MSDKTSKENSSQNSSDDRFDVAIMMGSKSDLPTVKPAADILRKLGVKVTMRVLSAHRTPEQAAAFVRQASASGTQVFICAAGLAQRVQAEREARRAKVLESDAEVRGL